MIGRRLIALAIFAFVAMVAGRARADGPTLSGTWSASAMGESWTVQDWGSECGPKPAAHGAGGGSVQIQQNGGELAMSGAGRAFSTSDCWEQMPGMARTGHSGGSRGWRTTCATPANDARQAQVVTSISATDSTISISESGRYRWNIKGQTCAASVVRSRNLTLVQREGEAPAAASGAPAPPTVLTAARVPPRCSGPPGEPRRLEVHPGRKVLKAGERFAFRAVVLDADGCSVAARPSWRLVPGPLAEKVLLDAGGSLSIAEDAPEGRVDVTVAIGDARARVAVDVASAANYDGLLAARSDAGDDEAVVAVIAAGSIGGAAGIATDAAKQRKYTFVVIVFGIAALLGFVGLVLSRRGRHAEPPGGPDSLARERGSAAPESMPGPLSSAPSEPAAAPTEAEPVPEVAREPRVREPKGKICPTCGERYRAEATFCGKDATQLVPLN